MVDDGVHHDVMRRGEFGHVVPASEARIDFGVVDWIEAGVGTIERGEERQHVHALVYSGETAAQDVGHRSDGAVTETIGVGDELHSVFHGTSFGSIALRDVVYQTGSILSRNACVSPIRMLVRACRTGSIRIDINHATALYPTLAALC